MVKKYTDTLELIYIGQFSSIKKKTLSVIHDI